MFRTFLVILLWLLAATRVAAQPAPQAAAPPVPQDLAGAPAVAVVPTATLMAGFLVNLARFTEWPAEGAGPTITLCVLGDPAVADALDQLIGDRQINGREVAVARLVSQRALRQCQLLFVAGTDTAAQSRALEHVARLPVLTVGQGEQFVRMGGVVGVFGEPGRKRFTINTDAVLRAGLTLSSRLLGLAKVVTDEDVQP
jgi:hypothetical protein